MACYVLLMLMLIVIVILMLFVGEVQGCGFRLFRTSAAAPHNTVVLAIRDHADMKYIHTVDGHNPT